MLTRLTHAAIAFAITAAVYQMYVLAVVPLVDPSLAGVANASAVQEPTAAREAVHKHRELLAAYFPAGHWTLTEPPITFEAGRAMFVLDDYQPNDQGQVRVKKCAILFFPRQRERGQPPPRDTIVLEAPHGAVLQMDEGVRQSGMSGFGRLQWGQLMGDITVRSDMREPGPEDDLLLTTRDVTMNEDLIYTDSKVDLRLGPHWGRGRELEIRLVAIERAQSRDSQPSLGGIDSLEIKHEVEAQFSPSQAGAPMAGPPVHVTSEGPFRFDFAHQVASFSEKVKLVQFYPEGQVDRLFSEELKFYFAKNEDVTVAESSEFGGFLPGSIEALGTDSAPVVLDSQSQQATARCQRLRIEVDSRRITLDQGNEVELTYQGSEIRARQLRYQLPPAGSTQKIGTLLAAGHGWLRAKAPGSQAQNPLEVRWSESMRLDRIDGKPVLTLHGRPRLDMIGMGRLWADAMTLHLRERNADSLDLLPGDVVPESMEAHGQVAIETPELSGKVNHLKVQIDYAANNLVLGQPDGSGSQRGRFASGQRGGRAYDVAGDRLEMLLTVRGDRPEVTSLDIYGDTHGELVFRESATGDPTTQPLEVRGKHLRVENADQPHAEFTLQGQPATITAAGMSIRAATLRMNRAESKAWIDSPGELHLPMKKDLMSGKPLEGLQFLVVRWQGGMQLEKEVVSFHGKVIANTNDGSLRTERLLVTLSEPVRFDGAAQQRQTELAQFECREGVVAEFKQRDEAGIVSVQNMKLRSFVANQQTGELRGMGPGEMESVHLASSSSKLTGFASTAPARAPAGQGLRFLRVEFKRDLRGNMHNRQVEVAGDAKAIYGPVDAWHQKLEISVRRNPSPETILITSERLAIAESPMARLNRTSSFGPIELSAEGKVTIEASLGEQGTVTTQSHKARYDQQKTMFVLEGDGRVPAKLFHQEFVGAPYSESAARKLWYNTTTGEGGGEGFAGGKVNQLGTRRQPLTSR